MTILFDHCVDRRLRRFLPGHEVKTTYEMGWATYKNGVLLTAAETQFEVFLTVDQSIPRQQNLQSRKIAVLVLVAPSNRLEDLVPLVPEIERTLAGAPPPPGQATIVHLPADEPAA